MSNLTEIRRRLDRLTQLGNTMWEQFASLSDPEVKEKAKKEGTRIGIGAGVSFFGLMIAAVASVYILAVVILLVNIALDRLWLSSLIVVGGFLLLSGAIMAIGAGIIHSSAKELSRSTEDITGEIKKAGEEMKTEVEELQKVAKREAEERQRQMMEMAKTAKAAAPFAVGAYAGYRILKKMIKTRREKRAILRVIELYEEARTQTERSGKGSE